MGLVSNIETPSEAAEDRGRTMRFSYITAGLMTGLAAGAIAAAPMAAAATNPSTTIDTGRTTTVDKKGHNAIVVKPPNVSTPSPYGVFGIRPPNVLMD